LSRMSGQASYRPGISGDQGLRWESVVRQVSHVILIVGSVMRSRLRSLWPLDATTTRILRVPGRLTKLIGAAIDE